MKFEFNAPKVEVAVAEELKGKRLYKGKTPKRQKPKKERDLRPQFALRLKKLMDTNEVTRAQLCYIAGLTMARVQRYCSGNALMPLDTLIILSNYFDVPLDDWFKTKERVFFTKYDKLRTVKIPGMIMALEPEKRDAVIGWVAAEVKAQTKLEEDSRFSEEKNGDEHFQDRYTENFSKCPSIAPHGRLGFPPEKPIRPYTADVRETCIRNILDITLGDMATYIGSPADTVRVARARKLNYLFTANNLVMLTDWFSVSVDYVLGTKWQFDTLPEDLPYDRELVKNIVSLSYPSLQTLSIILESDPQNEADYKLWDIRAQRMAEPSVNKKVFANDKKEPGDKDQEDGNPGVAETAQDKPIIRIVRGDEISTEE